MKFFLRVEQVNLVNVIGDTTDLSTVRGGGLIALSCAESVETQFKGLHRLYTGASSGLFEFDAPTIDRATEFCLEVSQYLRSTFSDGTFAVDFSRSADDLAEFRESIQTLQAKTRWRQMQSPRLVYPGFGTGKGTKVCELNKILPATHELNAKGVGLTSPFKKMAVSRSVYHRRTEGLGQKHTTFYQHHAAWPQDRHFTNDLGQLSSFAPAGRLHRKIALIYLDGNKFGSIFSACGRQEYESFSQLLKANSSSFLRAILSEIWNNPGVKHVEEGFLQTPWTWSGEDINNSGAFERKMDTLRLETLLWGGDEIIWVVPAWAGWWWLERFFEAWGATEAWNGVPTARQFEFPDPKDPLKRRTSSLTHGAGMVFCHHDAPIQRVQSLARKLAETPKLDKERNRFAYQVLESFDHLGTNPLHARQGRIPAELAGGTSEDSPYLVLDGSSMLGVRQLVHELKQAIPRSQVHAIALELCRHRRLEKGVDQGEKVLARCANPTGQRVAPAVFDQLARQLGGLQIGDELTKERRAAAWIHLNDLWDYLPEITWGRQ